MAWDRQEDQLRNLRIFKLLSAPFLLFGFVANSLFPQACFCGGACLHGFQVRAEARPGVPFHSRCSATQCKSCNLEDVQAIKASNTAHSTDSLETFDTPSVFSNISNDSPNANFLKIFSRSTNRDVNVRPSPTYLQNHSILL